MGPARHGSSSLLGREGFFLGKMGFREAVAAGEVALPQVREELEAQLSRFRELLGRAPTHVDGHQHVHVLPGARGGGAVVRSGPGGSPGSSPSLPRHGIAGVCQVCARCVPGVCLVLSGPGWGSRLLSEPLPHSPTGVCQVFAEALQAAGVRFTRLPLERGVGSCAWLEAPARAFACMVERDALAAVGPFSRHGLR